MVLVLVVVLLLPPQLLLLLALLFMRLPNKQNKNALADDAQGAERVAAALAWLDAAPAVVAVAVSALFDTALVLAP